MDSTASVAMRVRELAAAATAQVTTDGMVDTGGLMLSLGGRCCSGVSAVARAVLCGGMEHIWLAQVTTEMAMQGGAGGSCTNYTERLIFASVQRCAAEAAEISSVGPLASRRFGLRGVA